MSNGNRDGTYSGASGQMQLVLRLDVDKPDALGMLSGELNQLIFLLNLIDEPRARRYSFIADRLEIETNTQQSLVLSAPVRFFRLPDLTGTIRVKIDSGSAEATLTLSGYGYHREEFVYALQKKSQYLRSVELEIDSQEGVDFPPDYDPANDGPADRAAGLPATPMTIQSVYARAGVEIVPQPGESTRIAKDDGTPWTTEELNVAMDQWFALRQDVPSWSAYLLVVGSYVDDSYRGLMFDESDPLPRQGAAVFHDAFLKQADVGKRKRDFLRTAVHELGHAFNVLHCFQHGIPADLSGFDNPFMLPRAASLSVMNYPQLYPYGHNSPVGHDGSDEYWKRCLFEFDRIELQHIRHHDREIVMFGGEAFGIHGYDRRLEEAPADPAAVQLDNEKSDLSLTLRGKRVVREDFRLFELTEPVHLELKVEAKVDGIELAVPVSIESGFLAVYIQNPRGEVRRFCPIVRACLDEAIKVPIKRDVPHYYDLDLTFGRNGFNFDNPGTYLVRAVYLGGKKLTACSNMLRLQVGVPRNELHERLAADFFSVRHGRLLATGPTRSGRFSREIGFFREFEDALHTTAPGRAVAGYLGEAFSKAFRDVQRKPGARSPISIVPPNLGESMTYLDRALKPGERLSLEPATRESPSNLVGYRYGRIRALVAAHNGDAEGARNTLNVLKQGVMAAIPEPNREPLRASELGKLGALEQEIERILGP